MLNENLLSEKYYLSKLSMFMKESYGFTDSHFKIMLDHIRTLDSMCDYVINVLDIWNIFNKDKGEDYYREQLLETFKKKGDPEYEEFKPLDVIASIVGCSRVNTYEDGTGVHSVRLSNVDLLDLIKIRVVQNSYKGTFEQLFDLYKNKLGIEFYMLLIPDPNNEDAYIPANAAVYISRYYEDERKIQTEDTEFENGKKYYVKSDNTYTEYTGSRDGNPKALGLYERELRLSKDLQNLYKYSDLFIRSLGITYQISIIDSMDDIFTLNQDTIGSSKKLG